MHRTLKLIEPMVRYTTSLKCSAHTYSVGRYKSLENPCEASSTEFQPPTDHERKPFCLGGSTHGNKLLMKQAAGGLRSAKLTATASCQKYLRVSGQFRRDAAQNDRRTCDALLPLPQPFGPRSNRSRTPASSLDSHLCATNRSKATGDNKSSDSSRAKC